MRSKRIVATLTPSSSASCQSVRNGSSRRRSCKGSRLCCRPYFGGGAGIGLWFLYEDGDGEFTARARQVLVPGCKYDILSIVDLPGKVKKNLQKKDVLARDTFYTLFCFFYRHNLTPFICPTAEAYSMWQFWLTTIRTDIRFTCLDTKPIGPTRINSCF